MSGILNIGNIQANTATAASTFRPITASGGIQTTVYANGIAYLCHVFLTSPQWPGQSNSYTWTVTDGGTSGEVEYLIVGGGGGGGMDMGGGGGGGQVAVGRASGIGAGNYGVGVGAGGWGAPAPNTFRGDGASQQQTGQHQYVMGSSGGGGSSFWYIGVGGGGGGGSSYYDYTPGATGQNGSGGGGGASGYSNGSTRSGGSGTYPGGQGGGQYYSGGGGGAGTPGTPSTMQSTGGAGLFSDILGYGYYWGGGGGGSGYSIWGGHGGQGGGGGGAVGTAYGGRGYNNGSNGGGGGTSSQCNTPGGNAGQGTGGGGGGGSHYQGNNKGGNGGSGIVVIRYPLTNPNEQRISCQNGSVVAVPGTILQTVFVRTDRQYTYSAPAYNNGGASGGTPIGELGLTITPKRANSLLLVRWMINGEMQHDTVFTINRNGGLVQTPGYEGFNSQAGGFVPWSGVITGKYDRNDVNSTENNWFLQYWVPAGSTNVTTLCPAVRSASYGGNQTLYLNRTAGSTGQDSYECAVSTGYIMEIAQ